MGHFFVQFLYNIYNLYDNNIIPVIATLNTSEILFHGNGRAC